MKTIKANEKPENVDAEIHIKAKDLEEIEKKWTTI